MRGSDRYERSEVAGFQPRSRGLPTGLLDQPLYGWVVLGHQTRILQPVSTGFVGVASAALPKAGWKHAKAADWKRDHSLAPSLTQRLKRWSRNPSGKPSEAGWLIDGD